MSLNDPLANVLSSISTYDKLGKDKIELPITSKLIKNLLKLMNEEGYVGTFEEITEENGHKKIILNLLGNINKCGVIKPRFSVKVNEIQKYEERYLIAKDMGMIIISTPQGLMTHIKAKEKNLGGRLIAYCY